MKKISLANLETFLKSQCDALRGALDASEYRDYVIAMIFLKKVNDQFEEEQKNFKKELQKSSPDLTQEEILEEIENPAYRNKYEFFVPVFARWKVETLPIDFKSMLEREIAKADNILNDKNSDEKAKETAQYNKSQAQANLQWAGLLNVTENIGDAITIALQQLEEENSSILQGVLKDVNFNKTNTNGEKILSDEVLSGMIKDFNKYKLIDDNFEFPDLLGAAYEYLIKYFAEKAGKKGGEFYTPYQVVELMGKILKPEKNAKICDPTVGSGGLLINMKNYVESVFGSSKDLLLHGQEEKESTYKMCKMNMIFHGIKNANIQNGDTLLNPKLIKNGELEQYDIVVANPPFSQNYTTKDMKFKGRFQFWMSKKKQADFMFVQHMIYTLKPKGRMAVIMPHGVLFRSGEEERMRKWLITGIKGEQTLKDTTDTNCILEAVIGLPQSLFYGTGIPACILIINKKDSKNRKGVFFINADRDYKEGKNQNILRPEDIDKIAYVYQTKDTTNDKYSRFVTLEELEEQEYNCNIRRWVDNVPEPENQDITAHLHGGFPKDEIDALDTKLNLFGNLKELIFDKLNDNYYKFTDKVKSKEDINKVINNCEGYENIKQNYKQKIDEVWLNCIKTIEQLPTKNSPQDFIDKINSVYESSMKNIKIPVLNFYQGRGAIAQFVYELKYDFMSVVSSGWNAELIPEDEILKNQFPDLYKEQQECLNTIEEIQAKFDEVNNMENPEEWNEGNYDVMPKTIISEINKEIKENKSSKKVLEKEIKNNEKRIKAYKKEKNPDKILLAQVEIDKINKETEIKTKEVSRYEQIINELELKIKKHKDLDEKLKSCRRKIKEITDNKEKLLEQAREKISNDEAKKLILKRWKDTFDNIIVDYIEEFARNLQLDIENIYDKYSVTLSEILKEKDDATKKLNSFLKGLGYDK